jgi:ribosome biogenesis protein Nip4
VTAGGDQVNNEAKLNESSGCCINTDGLLDQRVRKHLEGNFLFSKNVENAKYPAINETWPLVYTKIAQIYETRAYDHLSAQKGAV